LEGGISPSRKSSPPAKEFCSASKSAKASGQVPSREGILHEIMRKTFTQSDVEGLAASSLFGSESSYIARRYPQLRRPSDQPSRFIQGWSACADLPAAQLWQAGALAQAGQALAGGLELIRIDRFWGYSRKKYARQGTLSLIPDRFRGILQERLLNHTCLKIGFSAG